MPASLIFTAASLLPVPLLALGALLGGGWAWTALAYLTLFAFILDELISAVDSENEFPAADILLIILALSHFGVLVLSVLALSSGMALGEAVALFLATGLFLGQIGNANAHELIHKSARLPNTLGKWVYISLLFGHHSSAHTLVHHRFVASAGDPNTALAGESYYKFLKRAWLGGFIAGLSAESRRQKSWRNHPYTIYLLGAGVMMGLALVLAGWTGVLAYLGLALFAQAQLLISDYVQHYGLTRTSTNGRLDPVGQEHSWNAPHMFTSYMMLHAPRHSAHHARPAVPFHQLDMPTVQEAPTLPYSLPAMSVLALVPPLWRKVMDPRLAFWQAQPLGEKAAVANAAE